MRLGSFMVRGAVMRMHRSYRLWCLETTLRWWWDGAGDGPPDHSVDEIERVPIPQLHHSNKASNTIIPAPAITILLRSLRTTACK